MTLKRAHKILRKYSWKIHHYPVPRWLDRLWRKATTAALRTE